MDNAIRVPGSSHFYGRALLSDWQPHLTAGGLVFLAMLVPMGLAWLIDTRMLAGVSVWAKPMKFAASLGLYMLTLGFFWQFLAREKQATRAMRYLAISIVATIALEHAYITLQAARGSTSHYNYSSMATSIGYAVMGILAVYFTSMAGVLGWQIWRHPRAGLSPAIKAGIVAGLILTVPLTLLTAGYMSSSGSHLVGANTDASGLWLVGWSTVAGDLRVPHFFATHAMQVVPIAALALGALLGWQRRWPVTVFSLAYLALTLGTFMQALAGRPFLGFLS